jgi:hypothetical protein
LNGGDAVDDADIQDASAWRGGGGALQRRRIGGHGDGGLRGYFSCSGAYREGRRNRGESGCGVRVEEEKDG